MKIKMSEVIEQRDSLKSSISKTKSQLSSAKKKLKSAVNSDALKGDVKDAIDNKINNYQVPLLTNYVNSLDVIAQGYDNLISTFKSIVSENSDSAIIDTDVLQQMVDKFDSPLEQLKTSSDAINKAIDEVADIVALTKVTTDDAVSEFKGAKKVLTNTIKDMGIFNNTVFTSEVGDILDEQNTQIISLSDLGNSSYTSKKAKNFYKKTDFKTEVKETNLVINDKNRKARLKSDLAKELQVSKYSGYLMEASLPTPLVLKHKKEKQNSDYFGELRSKTTDYTEWNKEAIGLFLEKTRDKSLKEGKNVGKSWGAKLQPRDSLGRFVKDESVTRRWVSGNLKKMSGTMSTVLGKGAEWGGRGLIALGYIEEVSDYYKEYHNVGRSISYAAISGTVGLGAGAVGSSFVGGMVAGVGITGLAAVAAPLIGAVVVGAVATVGVKALYENVKPVSDIINTTGDVINSESKKIGKSFGGLFNFKKIF